jgi:DNA polymerase III alpha subunit
MGIFKIAGLGGTCSAVMFSQSFAKYRDLVEDDWVGLFRGKVDTSRDEPSLLVDDVFEMTDPDVARNRKLLIDIQGANDEALLPRIDALAKHMGNYPGPTETFVSLQIPGAPRRIWRLAAKHRVGVNQDLVRGLENLLGSKAYHLR